MLTLVGGLFLLGGGAGCGVGGVAEAAAGELVEGRDELGGGACAGGLVVDEGRRDGRGRVERGVFDCGAGDDLGCFFGGRAARL